MRRNQLAILGVLIATIGACGGRSTLKVTHDGGESTDGQSLLDVKRDGNVDNQSGTADVATLPDGQPQPDSAIRDAATPDVAVTDSPRNDSTTDTPFVADTLRLDVPSFADTRDGTRSDGIPLPPSDGSVDAPPTLTSLQVTSSSQAIAVGIPFTGLVVTALMSDGTTSNVTALSTFTSSDATLIQVSGSTLTGVKGGASATITATYSGKTATITLAVSVAPLQSISIDNVVPITVGQYILITATGLLTDGTKVDITGQATWTSSDTTLATVALDAASAKEKVSGVKSGTLSVSATLQGKTGTAAVTVTDSPIASIVVTTAQTIIQRGVSAPFTATATRADGTTSDVTQQATWTSSDATIATVTSSSSGVIVKAVAVGPATISAAVGTVTGSLTVTVIAPSLTSIAVTPATVTLNVNATQPFKATGTYADNSTADLTVSSTWSSTTTAVSVSNAAGQNGLATALGVGTAQVQASFGGQVGSATVTVIQAVLTKITVTPNPLAVVLKLKAPLTATGSYQNAADQDITAQVAWTVTDGTIAGVSNATGTAGQVTGNAIGTTTVTATLTGISGQATVNVSNPTLTSITVAPATASVSAGTKQPFTATGNYDNNTTFDLTSQVTWASSNISVAQESNAAGSNGIATTFVAGTTTITATLNGVPGKAALTVTAPTISSIQIAPATPSAINVGGTQAFTANAVYANGTTAAITAAWTSSNTAVATVAAAGGPGAGREVATAVAAGTTIITATYQGLTASATLTVNAAVTLVGLQITPQTNPSIAIGGAQPFTANAIFSDGTSTNVTGAAGTVWTTSNANIASVSNSGGRGGGGGGLATGIAAGTVTITATYSGFTDSASLTVKAAATPVGLQITYPGTASVVVNGTIQFQANETWSDGTSTVVTNTATWTTSDGAIASITSGGARGGGRGLATGIAAGTVTVTATDAGLTDSVQLKVTAVTPTSLVVTPAAPSILVNTTQPFVATLVYSDNTSLVVTGSADWTSSDPTVATVTTTGGRGGAAGLATSYATGKTTITATYSGLSGTALLTVTDPPLSYVQVTTTTPNIPVQGVAQFTATAVFSDNSTRNVTGQAVWTSSSTTIAVVGNNTGRATGMAAGPSTITATYGGMSGSSVLTVAQGVSSIAVTPTNPTTVLGLPVAFTATATLTNNTILVVTGNASWVASDPTVATVTGGLATPVKSGAATITATYLGVSGASKLTVSPATLSSIAITPNPVTLSLASGSSQQLTAMGTYSDTTKYDLSNVVTWQSGTMTVATVSNANGSRGLATGLSAGTSSVTALFQGITSATDTVTVAP
jgi:hypothetical protein